MLKKLIYNISIFVLCNLFFSPLYALTTDIVTYKMVSLPITKLTFVFLESDGSVEDNFSKQLGEVKQYIARFGYEPQRESVLFIDAQGGIIKDGQEYKKVPPKEMDEKFLLDRYGRPFLKFKRKVLVGFLIPPQVAIQGSDTIKITSFKNISAKAFQSIDRIQDGKMNRYKKWARIYDRITMLNYVSLKTSRHKYIGMLEMHDKPTEVVTFLAIPGNQDIFIRNNKISY